MIMLLFITDLDGTLLDAKYSYEAARPALKLLSDLQIPLVLCTSKTRAEVEVCRSQLGNHHPFIVENGGALYTPQRYFSLTINSAAYRDGYAVIEFGDPYHELVQSLMQASAESGCPVRGFHQMSVEEISKRCNMSPLVARLAKQREYDEPFEILSGDDTRLTEAIVHQKKRWTRGGSFYHILGANDKAHCVNLLIHFYKRFFKNVVTIGLGDGLNDIGFLSLVDIPILLESPAIADLKKAVPQGRHSPAPGPQGWNAAVLEVIQQHLVSEGIAVGMDAALKESVDLSSSPI
jgi:mannosyl-3-phosphoglycerate phosphatase